MTVDELATEIGELQRLLCVLSDAFEQADCLARLQSGKVASDTAGLPNEVLIALSKSPEQLAQACEAVNRTKDVSKAAVSKFIRHNTRKTTEQWFKLDSAAHRFAADNSVSASKASANTEALDYYRTLRSASSDSSVSKLISAVEDAITQRVLMAALSDIAAGRPLRISEDLPGDLLLLRPSDTVQISKRRKDASARIIRLEDSIPNLLRQILERHPEAMPLCDQAMSNLPHALPADFEPQSYRKEAVSQLLASYQRWRAVPVSPRVPILLYPFSLSGRCTRLEWWSAVAVWTLVVSPVYFYANKYARIDHQQRFAKATMFADPYGYPSDQLPSELWVYALFVIIPIAYWSALSFDVRRCRDAGWDPYWVWFRLLGPLYTLVSPFFLGFAKSQSVEDADRLRELSNESKIRTVPLSESVVREPTASPARRPSPRPRTVEEEHAARERQDRKLLEAWRANRAKGGM